MNLRHTMPRTAILLGLCSLIGSAACDRSWRDENFATPGGGTTPTDEVPPRVRPTVPSDTPPSTTVLPNQPGQPSIPDVSIPGVEVPGVEIPGVEIPGVNPGPSIEGDASVEPGPEDPSSTQDGPVQNTDDEPGQDTDEGTGQPQDTDDGVNDTDEPGQDTEEPGQNTDDGPGPVNTESGQTEPPPAATSGEPNDTEGPPPSNTEDETTEPPPEPAEEFSKAALLRDAARCAVANYEMFEQYARTLASAIDDLVDDESKLAGAQQAFVTALLVFQRVEVFRVGPAARAMEPGGQDLRDWIYAYPQNNRCQVDRNLVSQVYQSDFSSVLLNARGLAALEYLLFERGTKNVCSAGIDINAKGTWAALSQSQLNTRRDAYARVIVNDIVSRADQLVDAWDADEGNFIAQLSDAGDGSTVYPTQQSALNALSHALFYVERETKDYKLGWPLGMVAECISGSCPYASELPYSRLSGPSIAQNLYAFRLLFQGCGENFSGFGFDDWLRSVDPDGDLADRMLTNLTAADLAIKNIPRPIEDAFYDAPDEARQIHTALKGVTDLLKTEFVTVLNLELPMTAEGDND